MIELKDIRKIYDKNTKRPVEALKGVSTVFPDRGMVFIVGKSGGGKSTLLNVLGGLDTYDAGDFLIDGVSTKGFTSSNWDSYRNHYVGFVFQDHHLMNQYNVSDNIEFALALQPKKNEPTKKTILNSTSTLPSLDSELTPLPKLENPNKVKISDCLKTVGLEGFEARNVKKLSGGQKQRVAIARALVKDYHLILADEPTGNLDKITAHEIFSLLKEISKNKLVIVVTHDVDAANKYADMAIAINNGLITESAQTNGFSLNPGNENAPLTLSCGMGKITLPKVRLSQKAIWKIIWMSVKTRVIRLFFTIAIASLILGFLTVFFHTAVWQPHDAVARLLSSENAALITRTTMLQNSEGVLVTTTIPFDEPSLSELETKFKHEKFYKVFPIEISTNFGKPLTESEKAYYNTSTTGVCAIDQDGLKSLGYTLLAGTYPDSSFTVNDILITKYRFEMYRRFGYKNADTINAINSYNDIIGKTIDSKEEENKYTIRGVLDTKFEEEKFADVKNFYTPENTASAKNAPNGELNDFYNDYIKNSIHRFYFSSLTSNQNNACYQLLQKNNKLDNREKVQFIIDSESYSFSDFYASKILGISFDYSTIEYAMLFAISMLIVVFIIASFALGCISETKKEIGILRCVGASKNHIYLIYIIEFTLLSLLITIISLLLSQFVFLQFIFAAPLGEMFFPIKFFQASFLDFSALIVVTLATSILTAIIRLLFLFKKTPVQILNDL